MRNRRFASPSARRGAVLMVVLVLLALFAVVAVTFVFFAEQEAATSQLHAAAEHRTRPDPDLLLGWILNRLIYGTNDSNSALIGQSFLENMYGQPPSTSAFKGSGKLHNPTVDPVLGPMGVDPYYFINYTGPRAGNLARYGGFNPPYTYPDHNCPFLGALVVDQRGAVVLARSFVRNGPPGTLSPWEPALMPAWWLDQDPAFLSLPPGQAQADERLRRRHMVLRPRPTDHRGFPPPEDPGGDVRNLPPGVSVLLPNGQLWSGNDSFWFDPNFPVQVGPDGRRYKPLFAVFIMDLDGKLNLNAHMNRLLATGANPGGYVSGHGLGPWEVGPPAGPLATTADLQAFQTEFSQLLIGATLNGQLVSRYNTRAGPPEPQPPVPGSPGSVAPYQFAGPFYARTDSNGINDNTANPQRTQPVLLPGQGGTVGWRAFPTYPAGFDNGQTVAGFNPLLNHPMLQTLLRTPSDRVIGASHLELLYRMGDTGTDALTSDILRLCPRSFTALGIQNRLRWMVTTHSFDRTSYGMMPWFRPHEDPTTNPNAAPNQYTLRYDPVNARYPQGPPIPFPPMFPSAVPGEFRANWQGAIQASTVSTGHRYQQLNQPLSPFPAVDPNTGRLDPTTPAYQSALQERKDRARFIYDLLREATGAYNPMTFSAANPATPPPTPEELYALRWLAQLAVNMVDYLDPDDYMTPFNWGAIGSPEFQALPTGGMMGATLSGEWVFGTELPRVLINEVYVEYVRPPAVDQPTTYAVWVEFVNPLTQDPALQRDVYVPGGMMPAQPLPGGTARLWMNAAGGAQPYPIYQVVLTKKDPTLRDPGNVRGEPDPNAVFEVTIGTGNRAIVSDFSDPNPMNNPPRSEWILPLDDNFAGPNGGNTGFYVLGPPIPFPGGTLTPTHVHPNMTYQEVVGMNAEPSKPTVILRRLANPHLPPDNNPINPMTGQLNLAYNPYITVDYFEDARLNNATGMGGQAVADRRSEVRRQPYAGYLTLKVEQRLTNPNMDQPQHSFFRHNHESDTPPQPGEPSQMLHLPFDWLVHLDRPIVSPLELLHVSAYKPHGLTQQFMFDRNNDGTLDRGDRFQHLAPWFDEHARLYRFLEFFECPPFMEQDRLRSGKININTLYQPELFHGWCDLPAQTIEVETVWRNLVESRDGPVRTDRPFLGDPLRRPFWSLTVGPQQPAGQQPTPGINGTSGLSDTWLRDGPGTAAPLWGSNQPRLLELLSANTDPMTGQPLAFDHPSERARLMTKLHNNLTTRSNVFAIWVTVGYFEVVRDPSTGQDFLGPEIGRADGQHVRHRMFAIVDRSVFEGYPGPNPDLDPRRAGGPTTAAAPQPVLYWTIIE